MFKEKVFYIGGDYNNNGLSWWLPIFLSYCKKRKIKTVLFQRRDISNLILNNKNMKLYTKGFKFIFLDDLSPFWAKKKIRWFRSPLKAFYLFFMTFMDYKNFKDQNLKQILMSIIDLSFKESKQTKLKLNKLIILKNCFRSTYYIWLSNFLSNIVSEAVLSHSVYFNRITILNFKKNKIKTFHVNNFIIFKQSFGTSDFSWLVLNKKIDAKLQKIIFKNKSLRYWKQRIKGRSRYDNANTALYGQNFTNSEILKSNFIFLHVFKDSPYSWIKNYNHQLFNHYYDWLIKTINILKESNEKWYIKFHPLSNIYGENIDELKSDINFLIGSSKNIEILKEKIPNKEIFKNCKKLVTYSGTASLEYAAFGKKAIVVYPNVLTERAPNCVYFPSKMEDYKQLLLKNLNNSISKNHIKKAQDLIYMRDLILSSQNDVEGSRIYQTTTKNFINKDVKKILSNLKKNKSYYQKYGKFLAEKNFYVGVSKNFINKLL